MGGKERLCGALVSSLRPAGLKLKQVVGKRNHHNCSETHAHTRQTNHYVAHLQVDYQTDTTVHIVDIRPYLWWHFILFSAFFICMAEIIFTAPTPDFTLFPPAATHRTDLVVELFG